MPFNTPFYLTIEYFLMKNVLFALLILELLLSNCSNKKNYLRFKVEENVECIPIPYPDILGISMQLLKEDSLLLINDFRGDSLIDVFDLKTQSILKKMIPVGNGPNELISPLEIHLINNNLFVFCRQTGIMYAIPKDSLLEGNKSMRKKFQVTSKTNFLYPLTDSLFVASGSFQKRYAFFNSLGHEISCFGEYPTYWYKEEELPNEVRAMFHQTEFAKHPTAPLFVTYSSHVLEIYRYDFSEYKASLIKSIPIGNYNYSFVDNKTMISTDKENDVEKGIMSLGYSSKFIYIVYNPNKNSDKNKKIQIQIIDWNGNPVKIMYFDKDITCLTIDEKEEKGYVIAKDPDDALMYFNLEE